MKCEETIVELNGAKRKLTLVEEQLQKALREKAAIAMEVGKTNDKHLKSRESLTAMETETNNLKRLLEDSEKLATETEANLQKVYMKYFMEFPCRFHSKKRTTCSEWLKTALNNVVLPTLFHVINNIVTLVCGLI